MRSSKKSGKHNAFIEENLNYGGCRIHRVPFGSTGNLAGYSVTAIDNLNDYYDVSLKQARLAILKKLPNYAFEQIDLSDRAGINRLFAENHFDCVINLAAQAGVRYSSQSSMTSRYFLGA